MACSHSNIHFPFPHNGWHTKPILPPPPHVPPVTLKRLHCDDIQNVLYITPPNKCRNQMIMDESIPKDNQSKKATFKATSGFTAGITIMPTGECFFSEMRKRLYLPTLIIKPYRCSIFSQMSIWVHVCEHMRYKKQPRLCREQFLCFEILNPVWSCQWGLMEALDRRIPIWLADG